MFSKQERFVSQSTGLLKSCQHDIMHAIEVVIGAITVSNVQTKIYINKQTNRPTQQTDRQTDKQTNKQTNKHCSRFAEQGWFLPVREQGGTGWYSQVVAIVTQVMKVVNDLIKVPELNQTMQQMSKEMMKAGLIEETMGEMMDDVFDTDDIEEDADAEVDKVGMQT
jgi:pantoate kinase